MPHHEFGLDGIALIGRLRHAEHRSIPEIHADLTRREVVIAEQTITQLLDRHDGLLALSCSDTDRLRRVTARGRAGDPGH